MPLPLYKSCIAKSRPHKLHINFFGWFTIPRPRNHRQERLDERCKVLLKGPTWEVRQLIWSIT
ncbi:hypothetical protein HYDPIDRAFT_114093 [Hydnomerulius pinastri MD-312]|uniref:Uncharacterized protein n=1 Tax=Hydnomerulius pinastri MD-312 TaxID=994086 RepID=A0A0C9W755_9AGAM|nr:hypothetical protein HYDPIDRAFT_114093 [Hydnomerulius pinastri MD-312]